MAFNKTDEMLEEFAVDDTGAFGRIRNVLKETGDMFLFGKPTPDILHIMIKLYHENIVKNLSFKDKDNISPHAKSALSGTNINNLQFMCGIIEMDDGQFYITISEAPKLEINHKVREEDKLFEKKEKILDQLLKNSNINVKYPEKNTGNALAKTTFSTLLNDNFKINWRHGNKPAAGVLNPKIITKSMISKTDLKEGTGEKDGGGKYNKFVLNNHILTDKIDTTSLSMNYNNELWDKEYTVNMVNSYKYLRQRITQGKSFAPFKKYKYDEPSADIECNNGSTCTESKLFSYVYNDLGKTFDDIKGFAVFWVGNSLPQHHHIKGYCYSPWIPKENDKLNKLRDDCMDIINEGKFKPDYINDPKFVNVLKDVLQPVAMACPGCYSNYLKYTKGNMGTKWDQQGCYMEVSPRTVRAARREADKLAAARRATTLRTEIPAKTRNKSIKSKTLNVKKGARPRWETPHWKNERRQAAINEAVAAAENNVYGNNFSNWGPNESASVQRQRELRALPIVNDNERDPLEFITSIKGKHKGGNRTHKRKNQKRRNTRRLKHHRHT